jgi:serine/threonine protein kinase
MGKSQSKGGFAFCGSNELKKDKIRVKESEKIIDQLSQKYSLATKLDSNRLDIKLQSKLVINNLHSQKNSNSTRDSSSSKDKSSLKRDDTILKHFNTQRNISEFSSHFTDMRLVRHPNVRRLSSFNPNKKKTDISNFDKIKVIGRGTFGKVILVKSKDDNRLYALKCVKKIHILKTNNLQNILSEKKIYSKIDSPFIIKLRQTFQDKEMVYFLFDYYNGGELFFHIQRVKRFSEEMVKFYAAEIYCALEYLHSKKIIYRDLKPENIVLDLDGHIKLIDFGLAKDFNSKKIDFCSTFCGTNEYIPPEVIMGEKYSFNFDWWGFGNIIYEMFYGRPAFTEKSGNKNILFHKILTQEPNYTKYKMSNESIDLMMCLLKKNKYERLSPCDIPNHPFFRGIDFSKIREKVITPPLRPKVKDEYDLTNFDSCFLKENINSPLKKLKYDIDQSKFAEF